MWQVIRREVEIVNELGMHARAAAKLVQTTGKFRSNVNLEKDGQSVDGKSILGILLLAAAKGSRLWVRVEGDDEEEAVAAIVDLVADRFGDDE